MGQRDRILDHLRQANPVPPPSASLLSDPEWGRALEASILQHSREEHHMSTASASQRRAPRRRVYLALSLGLLLVTSGTVVAITGLPGTHNEPLEPAPELAQPSDPPAAATADRSAAERILKAGGWTPQPGTLRIAATSHLSGSDYALWAYRGANGPAALLIGEPDELGGVHADCESAEVALCGMASSSTGYLLAIGSTDPTAARTTVTLTDGSSIDAPTGAGYWFARVPFSASSPRPLTVTSYGAAHEVVGQLDASRLRQEITTVLAGPPALG